jgi:hypothetical protein
MKGALRDNLGLRPPCLNHACEECTNMCMAQNALVGIQAKYGLARAVLTQLSESTFLQFILRALSRAKSRSSPDEV